MNFESDVMDSYSDAESCNGASAAQLQQIEDAWNQQDAVKIAQDLNALLQAMMQSSEAS